MNRTTPGIFSVALLFAAACSHDYHFKKDPKIEHLTATKVDGKKVKLDLTTVPVDLDLSANGHSYHMVGVRTYVETILNKAFGPERMAAVGEEDIVLAVNLEFTMGATLTGVGVECRSRCVFRGMEGKELSSGEAKSESSRGFAAQGAYNVDIALLEALPLALDHALAGL